MNCGNCRFYQGTQFGHCRRFPETVTKQAGMWCGEHQLVEPLPEPLLETEPQPAPEAPKKRGRRPKDESATSA